MNGCCPNQGQGLKALAVHPVPKHCPLPFPSRERPISTSTGQSPGLGCGLKSRLTFQFFFFTWIHCKGIIKTCVFAKLKSKGLKTKRIKNVTLIFNVVDLFVPLDPSSWNITLPGNVIKHPNKLCRSCDACILVYPKTLYSSCRKMFL